MSAPEITFEQIGGRVMQELHRRLATPELAQDLPGTLLMKVASDYVKHLERRNEIEQAKLEEQKQDPLEVVINDALPWDMRFEILSEFIDELESAWQRATPIMETMLEEVRTRDSELLLEGQDVVPEGGGMPGVRAPGEVQQEPPDGAAELAPGPDGGEVGDLPQDGAASDGAEDPGSDA